MGCYLSMNRTKLNALLYAKLLKQYLMDDDPRILLEAEQMSTSFMEGGMYPEEIIRIHIEAVEELYGGVSDDYKKSLLFLFESMDTYGNAFNKYDLLRQEQQELKAEIQIAANMQRTLLATQKPVVHGLDIGAISIPYNQMNGDYYHFDEKDDEAIGITIADVMGKGVPAALSMSMIKYSLDIFYDDWMNASGILRYLNRVVTRNIASDMFITMFYAQYFPSSGIFRYASAGHEPGLLYRAAEGTFTDIEGNGIVLGVIPDNVYEEYELVLDKNDMIILLTDGVTECRSGDRFITRQELINVILMYAHLPAQEHVEEIYNHFNLLTNFQLDDDFTLIILKKTV